MWHYNKELLVEAFKNVGLKKGDIIYSHVSLGRLGYPEEGRTMEIASRILIESILEVIGKEGTVIIPTYTYSIGKGDVFDVNNSPSEIGEFTEIFRNMDKSKRTKDPMMSVSGVGPVTKELFDNIPPTCFGSDSIFDRFKKRNGKLVNIGVSLYYSTFRHYIEEMAEVPFRFHKEFEGTIKDGEMIEKVQWTYFARYLIDNCYPNGIPLEKIAKDKGICKISKAGRSDIVCVNSNEYYELGMSEFKRNPWLTANGPALSIEELQKYI